VRLKRFFSLPPEVREYLIDDRRVFYTSDDFDRSTTLLTGSNINIEYSH
jgi:hypothetical protein